MLLGGYVVGYAPLVGELVDRSADGILWTLVVFFGLFLIVSNIRDIVVNYKKEETGSQKAKRILKRIFSFQKGIPSAEVILCLMLLLSLGVAFTIVRGVQDFATTKSPNKNGEIKVITFNIFQGATYPTGKPNMDRVKDFLEAQQPDIVHLQESNSNNMFDLNIDSVNYLASNLRLNEIYGPRGGSFQDIS